MKNKITTALLTIALMALPGMLFQGASGADWPIYKGNIYFTGNNDEIVVKNSNLKWLFQAEDQAFNPIVSDGMVYFVDLRGNVYCLDEEYGKLVWKIEMKKIAAQFKAFSKAAGKIKYPLVMGNILFISDPIAIYALDKRTGTVLWARTGMRTEETKREGLSGRGSRTMVDGIYSDPFLMDDRIYYGTRNTFMARETRNGHVLWDNGSVKTYSGFPTYYDTMVFTQSMDYSTGAYRVYCLRADNGKEIWSRAIEKPMKIFPPVVYKQKLYLPSNKSLYCLDLKTGENSWVKEYADYITSNPSFTDRAVIFSVGNSDIAVVSPENGETIQTITVAPKSSPHYVTVRDQVYVAYNEHTQIKGREIPFGRMKAFTFGEAKPAWEYRTPFPGGVSQPVASKGIMIIPAGNYLYAIGTEYYARIVDGGDGYAVAPDRKSTKKDDKKDEIAMPAPYYNPDEKAPLPKKQETRKITVTVNDPQGSGIPADIDIRKTDRGIEIYSEKRTVNGKGEIDVPAGDSELLVSAPGYVPKKVTVTEEDKEKVIELEKIEKGKSYVIDNILFDIDKAYLKRESLNILDKLIRIMKGNPGLNLEVRGHTDSTGERAYNMKLSERRADAVIEYMIKNGVSPVRLRAVGFGDTKPIASNATPEGRKKNRRTEFYFPK